MTDRVALIGPDNTLIDDDFTGDADALAEGQRLVNVPDAYPEAWVWSKAAADRSPNDAGWMQVVTEQSLITVGRFKLLLTKDERVAIRAAAAASADVEDFLDLLNGFTDGISLSDPILAAALGEMVAAELLTGERVAEILSGTAPA